MGLPKGRTNNSDGRPIGTKNKKTGQWEKLSESIVTTHAERFNRVLEESSDEDFAKLFKDVLNYFKPRINHNINEAKQHQPINYQDVSEVNKDLLEDTSPNKTA